MRYYYYNIYKKDDKKYINVTNHLFCREYSGDCATTKPYQIENMEFHMPLVDFVAAEVSQIDAMFEEDVSTITDLSDKEFNNEVKFMQKNYPYMSFNDLTQRTPIGYYYTD